ncbi:hypothetical protein [Spirosoma sp. KUDC1026]|uniref:hypothetical protein n=1 Tax=Spirosoma sp. KUDC1026 TaxID=2745947 RepID=UPI00159BDC47|nr:hypothetical protein [Spirosoma sp. KUDC1026]QKZ15380.1 hypothetical protein HU175_23275 [Spirosoma sp. KUDC1026]
MKTYFRLITSSLLVAFTIFTAASASPIDGSPSAQKSFAAVMYPAAATSKVWLHLEKFKLTDKINVELYDERGKQLFSETLPQKAGKRNTYRQQFDLSGIPDGKYTFRLSSGNQTEEVTFNLTTPTVVQQTATRFVTMK